MSDYLRHDFFIAFKMFWVFLSCPSLKLSILFNHHLSLFLFVPLHTLSRFISLALAVCRQTLEMMRLLRL